MTWHGTWWNLGDLAWHHEHEDVLEWHEGLGGSQKGKY